MSESATISGSGFFLTLAAFIMLLLIVPAASAAGRRIKPGWRAWVWPLFFGCLALTGLFSSLAAAFSTDNLASLSWKIVNLMAGLSFTFLTLNTLYRAFSDELARRLAPLIWVVYLVFAIAVLAFTSFVPVLVYDAVCSILVFLTHSTLYAHNRDRNIDARHIMVGTGLILLADLVASFQFNFSFGPLSFNQLLPYDLLQIAALIFFYMGASASYSLKYDKQRSQERALMRN
ncbi:MAG TPA: hypothetical protein VH186_10535 [Chloroflexia bacterium]|nr:hypothetical protein [Chloroflexia bacterium]